MRSRFHMILVLGLVCQGLLLMPHCSTPPPAHSEAPCQVGAPCERDQATEGSSSDTEKLTPQDSGASDASPNDGPQPETNPKEVASREEPTQLPESAPQREGRTERQSEPAKPDNTKPEAKPQTEEHEVQTEKSTEQRPETMVNCQTFQPLVGRSCCGTGKWSCVLGKLRCTGSKMLHCHRMAFLPKGQYHLSTWPDFKRKAGLRPLPATYIDLYEVSKHDYHICVQQKKCKKAIKEITYTGKTHPITGVTWEDANAFCKWSGKHLPTEQEWEAAAKGKNNYNYPWGNQKPDCSLAQHDTCQGNLTKPVDSLSKGRSLFGLHHLTGNAFEWVMPATYLPRLGLLKGGAFTDHDKHLNVNNRHMYNKTVAYRFIGFRCARSADLTR